MAETCPRRLSIEALMAVVSASAVLCALGSFGGPPNSYWSPVLTVLNLYFFVSSVRALLAGLRQRRLNAVREVLRS